MALASSLFTGTSGLINMGNTMQVVSNNIANSNTVGFKKGISSFADTLSQSVSTQAGVDQIGRGMALGEVAQSFTQGSFESTGNATDLSIGGDGFFVVSDQNTDTEFYTRAGNFHFSESGELVNPEGYIVQGWELDNQTGEDVGAIGDIVMDTFTSAPQKSSQITAITNLDSDAVSKSDVLANFWDAAEETPLEGEKFEYLTVVKVYDSLGSSHDVSIYYDKKSTTDWEYIVTCDPKDDLRDLVQGTSGQGLLARGTIEFNQSSGVVTNMTMSEFTGLIGNVNADGVNYSDNVHFAVDNYDAIVEDGYDMSLQFNGTEWVFSDPANLPPNYSKATITESSNQRIEIALNADDKIADLIITLDNEADLSDILTFDINAKANLHVQGVEGSSFVGETKNGNTQIQINDPGVMNLDSSDVKIICVPGTAGGPATLSFN